MFEKNEATSESIRCKMMHNFMKCRRDKDAIVSERSKREGSDSITCLRGDFRGISYSRVSSKRF